ncbi:MAG: helix-turn-helix transcriptional regulator [Clostridia bacterium]|nr:helix-turn-helix transcriptional regulator [Clostridia bacterium]
MAELKIAENILSLRRKLKLTQEELASALSVSSQAVSNWERGGYPDITLLPRIANYFKITVDELIGNDEVTKQADIEDYRKRYSQLPWKDKITLAKEDYRKYPSDFTIMEELVWAIMKVRDAWATEYELVKEVCTKILAECSWEYTRQNATEAMSIVCTDEDWENWQYKSEQFYSSCLNERIEERYWRRGVKDKFENQSNANDLLTLMHFLGREYMRYYEQENGMLFENPARTAALMKYRMRILESITEDGTVPEAWCGCYADCCLKAAGALIGAGEYDEGFAYLEKSFELYERWLKIPDGAWMDVGNPVLFENAEISKVAKGCVVNIRTKDNTEVWSPYLWLFWQLENDIERALANWSWFDQVREDPRYIAIYEKAKSFADKQ